MTCRRKQRKNAVIYFVKTGSIEGELRLNGAAATQTCLENTKAFLWGYRTSVNGTVSSRMVFPWIFGDNRKVWLLYVTFNGTLIDHDNLLTASK